MVGRGDLRLRKCPDARDGRKFRDGEAPARCCVQLTCLLRGSTRVHAACCLDNTLPLICTRGVWASPALSDCVRPRALAHSLSGPQPAQHCNEVTGEASAASNHRTLSALLAVPGEPLVGKPKFGCFFVFVTGCARSALGA
eukprot:scaffold55612_cov39-Phaeocystis_antarctica.AAC.1